MARLTLIAKFVPDSGYVPVVVLEDHIYSKSSKVCSCGETRSSVFAAGYEFEFHHDDTDEGEGIYRGI